MILGIDVGTSTISIALCHPDGRMERAWNLPNESSLPGERFQYRQDAEWICRRIEARLEEISAQWKIDRIGITCQMHGILYVDESGRAVSPFYTWEDESGLLIAPSGRSYLEELNERTGAALARGIAFGSLTHYYLTQSGSIPAGAARFCGIGDYLAMRLTGSERPKVHVSLAGSFGLYSLEGRCFDAEAIGRAGMDARYYPEIARGFAPVGRTANGAMVSAAIGDNQASFLGSVSDWEGEILLNLGTGGQISCYSRKIIEGRGIETRPLLDDSFLAVYTSHCGGRAYAALERFYRAVLQMAGVPCDSLYQAMEREVQRANPEDCVDVDPAFCGSRANPTGRCVIGNLTLDNFTPADLTRGFLLGICRELHPFYEWMRQERSFRQITGSGNAIRRNAAMQRAVEEVFGLPLRLTASEEEAALGAVWFARQLREESD